MIILGICFLSDASACVLKDGKILAAVSEERLNRKKLWNGIPKLAIDEVIKLSGIKLEQIDLIATHGVKEAKLDDITFQRKFDLINQSSLKKTQKKFQIKELQSRLEHERLVIEERTPRYISEIKNLFPNIKIETFDHHECHASVAYFGSEYNEAFALTADGWGEDASATLWKCKDNIMSKISTTPTIDSLGYFYGSITKYLNFTPHKHEGKVLGLAAYVDKPKSLSIIETMISFDKEKLQFLGLPEKGIYLPKYDNKNLEVLRNNFSREDVASSTQKVLEKTVCGLVSEIKGITKRNTFNLCVAGGIFANVKLNQKLSELKEIKNLFVFPNMGDGGLCVGAAWLSFIKHKKNRPFPIKDMRIGSKIEDVETVLNKYKKYDLTIEKHKNINKEIAFYLQKGVPVIRVEGPMEFGPRALGNRSILCDASDPDINKRLNHKLNRSEFMPFAPITLKDKFEDFYLNYDSNTDNLPFMTSTLKVKKNMMKEAPASVHVDETARPQLIEKKLYSDLYEILIEYKKLTGKSSLINTSFNMHEEPIVCTTDDAMRAFISSNLPYIAINNYLIINNASNK
jgi:carbamoyltransferase